MPRPPTTLSLTHEQKLICAAWVRVAARTPLGRPDKNEVIRRAKALYGIAISPNDLTALAHHPDFRLYKSRIKRYGRERAKKILDATADEAAEDYLWAREEAKAAKDYKEVRVAAGDHLDRVGVRAAQGGSQVNVVTVVLRGRNFDAASLMDETPAIESKEIVVEHPEIVE